MAKNLTFNMGSANFPEISNHTFVANDVQFEMPVGEAVGLDLNGVSSHPFHIHVNPFQLTQNPLPDNDNNWFRSGDWHDTLFYPAAGESNQRVLTQTDYFTGPSVVHCHILHHEDWGMMITFNITGEEGTRFPPAYGYEHTPAYGWVPSPKERIDPTCYDGMMVERATITTEGKCVAARTKAGAVTALQLSTATAEAHTWKVIAIVLGVVLAAVLIGAAVYLLRGTANNAGGAPASSGGAVGTELM